MYYFISTIYLEFCQITTMELFTKIILAVVFEKRSIVDVFDRVLNKPLKVLSENFYWKVFIEK